MSRAPLLVVGDAMLDRDVLGSVGRVSPDAPAPVLEQDEVRVRPGGAALAAAMAASDGRQVTLVTALARDAAALELAEVLGERGVTVLDVGRDGATPEKIRIRAGGQTLARIDRGCARPAPPCGDVTDDVSDAFSSAAAVLVADYGYGVAGSRPLRRLIRAAGVPVVWDPHPHGANPVPGVTVVTPNAPEARRFAPEVDGRKLAGDVKRARALVEAWQAGAVAVTLGARGMVLVPAGGPPVVVPARTARGDVCGAGDRLAAALAGCLADGHPLAVAAELAVACAADYVARGGPESLDQPPTGRAVGAGDELAAAQALAATVRARGGTVVATSGCFDLLHAGHIGTLRGARALGDCLVVLLNSDSSVRRLKGHSRPIVAERDRATVLAALECVDAVVTFDGDTPVAVLEALRPDVYAKGGDYDATSIAEAEVMERQGGQVAILPFVTGRSTTRLIEEVGARGR
jgi:D-beta-D-heptose 7-phosphate kinase/D-beta-D-heptose 1-phosphate adenosyltransferase